MNTLFEFKKVDGFDVFNLDYDWGNDKAHDSLSDCKATLYC